MVGSLTYSFVGLCGFKAATSGKRLVPEVPTTPEGGGAPLKEGPAASKDTNKV